MFDGNKYANNLSNELGFFLISTGFIVREYFLKY